MSYAEQEKAVFDLLFDKNLRLQFSQDKDSVLQNYDLSVSEQEEFKEMRSDALMLDADMRCDLLLSHFCKSLPLSFSLLSSWANGISLLQALITPAVMNQPHLQRTTAFSLALKHKLPELEYTNTQEQMKVASIIEAESGLAYTAASLKEAVVSGAFSNDSDIKQSPDWRHQNVSLAAYVCAGILPQAWHTLAGQLCKKVDDQLWRRLNRNPLSQARRQKILAVEEPRLLVARAYVTQASVCDPVVEHKTVELSEGFAALFEYVNGSMSIHQILMEMKKIGAPEPLLNSIDKAFEQLMQHGMLVTAS